MASASRLPPLVVSWEIEQRGGCGSADRPQVPAHGGDCAETFEECESDKIAKKLKILLQMSLVLCTASSPSFASAAWPPVRQAAIGRHRDPQRRHAARVPRRSREPFEFTAEAREPDPTLLLRGYERAALTLNFVRVV